MPAVPGLLLPTSADQTRDMTCACCGEDRPVAALGCRDDVHICRDCAGCIAGRLGVTTTPILPITDLAEATAFYERAGFDVHAYIDPTGQPGDFAFVHLNDQSVFNLDVTDVDPAHNRAGCYLVVTDVDDWHRRLSAARLPITGLDDQPWGMREFALTDSNGNAIRFGQPTASD